MASYTPNYNLKKPATTDFIDIADLNGNMDIIDGVLEDKADLDSGGKVPVAQIPGLDYIPTSQKAAASGVASLDSSGKVPTAQLPSMDYIPTAQKGAASGVAALDSSSKVPAAQIPSLDYIPTSQKAAASGVASLGADGKVPSGQLPSLDYIPTSQKAAASGVASLGTDTKIPIEQIPILAKQGIGYGTSATAAATAAKTATLTSFALVTGAIVGITFTYANTAGSPTLNVNSTGAKALYYNNAYITADMLAAGQTALFIYNGTQWVLINPYVAVDLSALYLLKITFDSSYSGLGFTVTATGESKSGTVPAGLVTTVGVSQPNTTYTITCNGDTKTVTTGAYFGIYPATIEPISTTFANNTWTQIASVSAAGTAANYWQVGDEKSITVNGETLTLVILAFAHDDLSTSGKAGITLGLKNLMAATSVMNSTNTNAGGFTGSAMYTWLSGTLLPLLPSDLQAVLKTVNKLTSAGSSSATINTNAIKLFLFSEIEIFGAITYAKAGEGSQYSYFATAANRIKYLSNGAGAADIWWERSPYGSYSAHFCCVSSVGGASYGGASSSFGVCFGFCV